MAAARLRARSRPRQAIEELIRWDPPLQLFERWVLEDGVEVAGVPVPRGEMLSMLFGAANRDPRVFDDPDRLDVARANAAEHIGFGGGIHVCIGAPLARIELDAGFEALVEPLPHAPPRRAAGARAGVRDPRLRVGWSPAVGAASARLRMLHDGRLVDEHAPRLRAFVAGLTMPRRSSMSISRPARV